MTQAPLASIDRLTENETLYPDLGRALRTTVAFMAPLILAQLGWLHGPVLFAAIAAQSVALIDVNGDYRVRLGVLLGKALILTAASWLGSAAGASLLSAVLATGLIAMGMGYWRHLSSDYGPSVAASSALLFLIALSTPAATAPQDALYALGGALWGVLLQASLWPFRPQHPLRQSVAESWLAVGELFAAFGLEDGRDEYDRQREISEKEAHLRVTIDKTTALLTAPGHASAQRLQHRLATLNLTAARLSTRVAVLNTALEALRPGPGFARLTPVVQPILTALTNTARTVALGVVSRQPTYLATAGVRLERLANLIQALEARLTAQSSRSPRAAELAEVLKQIAAQVTILDAQLQAVTDRAAESGAFSLELFDLDAWTLRPLAAILNQSRRIDPALLRFTARLAVLMMLGVAIFEYWHIPRGYWLSLTIVVVLQPDYGSTRLRAAQRLVGTLIGGALASVLLWLKLPHILLLTATAGTIFGFSYYLKKNYAIAVFFITLMIVLLTEASSAVTIDFTISRLVATVAGGALAMLAALLFWPVWEWQRYPTWIAEALRANREFLQILHSRLSSGGTFDLPAAAAKRRAESANGVVFSSLQRMATDPKRQRDTLAQSAAIANGNQRLTRSFTTIAVHLKPGSPVTEPEITRFVALASETLEALALSVLSGQKPPPSLQDLLAGLESFQAPLPESTATSSPRDQWVFSQMTRAALELSAMILAA
ncbi:MAG: FUSC family protein, partial [Opitutaceae bacterium]